MAINFTSFRLHEKIYSLPAIVFSSFPRKILPGMSKNLMARSALKL